MGFIHEEHGRFAIETRQESFIVHAEDEPQDRHPEYFLTDAPDLIEALLAVFPVGEPDASQKTINGLLDAVERLNGQKDALRCENGQLRELLDLPVGERVQAVAELVGEPDDERLTERVAEALWNHEQPKGYPWARQAQDRPPVRERYLAKARAAVAAVRAASQEKPE